LHPGGVWGDRRLIIFTEYRATQNWLHNRLSGGAGTKTATASAGGHCSATRRGGKGS
jgi:ERCC4-related helicase